MNEALSTCTVPAISFISIGVLLPADVVDSLYVPMVVETLSVSNWRTSDWIGAALWAAKRVIPIKPKVLTTSSARPHCPREVRMFIGYSLGLLAEQGCPATLNPIRVS